MKRFLPIVMLVVAQLGCASQEVRLQVHDGVTQETLGHVNVTLRISHPPKEFFGSRWSENKKLVEGKNNEFTFAYPIIEDVRTSLAIHKPGYYYTSYPLPQKKGDALHVDISLKPKQKPIPLIAIYWDGVEPTFPYDVSASTKYYDCIKADWLPPDGEGTQKDLEFSLQRYRKGRKVFAWFKIRFTNPNDGFEEIVTPYAQDMFIREAPSTPQLLNQLDFIEELHDGIPVKFPAAKQYAFRVRTQRTPSGELFSAYYGKFYDAFSFNFSQEAWKCGFEYYLNPTPNNRNLEYNGTSLNVPKIRAQRIRRIK